MREIKADMHICDSENIWAYGTVTIDSCIKFSVQMRKYFNPKSEKEESFVSFPRRESKGKWENIVYPEPELREEIERSVVAALKVEVVKDLHLPEIEEVIVTPICPYKSKQNAKAVICGLATIKVCGLTIKGITVKQGEKGLFINMPQCLTGNQKYKDIVYATTRAMQDKITQSVLDTYQEVVKEKGSSVELAPK